MKEFWKSFNIRWSYRQEYDVWLFFDSWCTCSTLSTSLYWLWLRRNVIKAYSLHSGFPFSQNSVSSDLLLSPLTPSLWYVSWSAAESLCHSCRLPQHHSLRGPATRQPYNVISNRLTDSENVELKELKDIPVNCIFTQIHWFTRGKFHTQTPGIQVASWMVQPFLHGSSACATNTQTTLLHDVCSNSSYSMQCMPCQLESILL